MLEHSEHSEHLDLAEDDGWKEEARRSKIQTHRTELAAEERWWLDDGMHGAKKQEEVAELTSEVRVMRPPRKRGGSERKYRKERNHRAE